MNPTTKYPYPTITKKKALDDYNKLVDLDVRKYPRSNVGNKALDLYFYKLRVKTIVGKWSHYSAWNDKTERKKILRSYRLLGYDNKEGYLDYLIRRTAEMRYGSINQFKPSIAKYIYYTYNPKTILDFSAGWGGRLLGAMSLNKNYIGIDSNIKLKKAYENVIKNYKSNSKIKLIFKKSEDVDFSKLKYDMVFTSPPYEFLEKYEGMKDYEDFYEEFLNPVILKTFKYLDKGGTYLLNVPQKMYLTKIKKLLGKYEKKILLKKSQRPGGRNYKEYIYVWTKI